MSNVSFSQHFILKQGRINVYFLENHVFTTAEQEASIWVMLLQVLFWDFGALN